MSLMERFADPELIHSLSMGDKAIGTLITALMGMGVTFAVLAIIWLMIVIMGKIMGKMGGKGRKEGAKEGIAKDKARPGRGELSAKLAERGGIASDDAELTAVMAAAIAAYEEDNNIK